MGSTIGNPIVALDAPRPDFNGALAQFLIGLLQTVCAPADEDLWEDWLWSPPTPEMLAQRFAPLAPCFQLDGDGPRFMQDFDAKMEGKENRNYQRIPSECHGGVSVG